MDQENNGDRILKQDPTPVPMPPNLEDKVVQRLKERELIQPTTSIMQSGVFRIAASLVLIISAAIAGYFIGRNDTLPAAATDPELKYLLLLYNPSEFEPDPSHVGEYGTWMTTVNDKTTSFDGEELTDFGWTLTRGAEALQTKAKPVVGEYGALSGFFVLNTNSAERALEIAGSCPHLKYNGVVELRPIKPQE